MSHSEIDPSTFPHPIRTTAPSWLTPMSQPQSSATGESTAKPRADRHADTHVASAYPKRSPPTCCQASRSGGENWSDRKRTWSRMRVDRELRTVCWWSTRPDLTMLPPADSRAAFAQHAVGKHGVEHRPDRVVESRARTRVPEHRSDLVHERRAREAASAIEHQQHRRPVLLGCDAIGQRARSRPRSDDDVATGLPQEHPASLDDALALRERTRVDDARLDARAGARVPHGGDARDHVVDVHR